jgi:hypothetical protein
MGLVSNQYFADQRQNSWIVVCPVYWRTPSKRYLLLSSFQFSYQRFQFISLQNSFILFLGRPPQVLSSYHVDLVAWFSREPRITLHVQIFANPRPSSNTGLPVSWDHIHKAVSFPIRIQFGFQSSLIAMQLPLHTNFPSWLILFTLIMNLLLSSETSVLTKLHSVISQKKAFLIVTDVKPQILHKFNTSNHVMSYSSDHVVRSEV